MVRVLVVEDDQLLRDLIAETLGDEGYAVEEAANGEEALAQVRQRAPDLVVLDLMMPVMDGWSFARAWHAERAHATPIVVLSAAHGLAAAAEELAPFGVRATLAKPFDLEVLAAVVGRLASGPHPL